MAAGLDIWVAAPGSACTVDDGAWVVTVCDAHDNPFSWGGMSYAGLAAPAAHWVGAVPPGTYVVRAVSKDGTRTTDRAIAAVSDDVAVVRLYVGGGHREEPPGDCKVAIRSATPAARGGRVLSVDVQGVATGCGDVDVTVAYGGKEAARSATVASNQRWKAKVDVRDLGVRCGDGVVVTARCASDEECGDVLQTVLDCPPDTAADRPARVPR